jgi:hypothetical protein
MIGHKLPNKTRSATVAEQKNSQAKQVYSERMNLGTNRGANNLEYAQANMHIPICQLPTACLSMAVCLIQQHDCMNKIKQF